MSSLGAYVEMTKYNTVCLGFNTYSKYTINILLRTLIDISSHIFLIMYTRISIDFYKEITAHV